MFTFKSNVANLYESCQLKSQIEKIISISSAVCLKGIVLEVVNRVQNIRKENGLDVTDRILVSLSTNEKLQIAIQKINPASVLKF